MGKNVTRLYTGPDGESHFEDIEISTISTKDEARVALESQPIKATHVVLREVGGSYETGWHNAPRRQFLIGLEGELEIEVGDGSKRLFGPGDILLAEDTTGRGHISRSVRHQPRKSMVVPLA